MIGFGIFLTIGALWFFLAGLSEKMSHKKQLLQDEELKKSAFEMGFNERSCVLAFNYIGREFIGNYRNHKVTIDEVGGSGEESSWTRYRVDFENPQMFLLYIRRSFPHGYAYSSLMKHILNIELNDPQFDGLVISGNKEDYIKSILDSSIRSRLMTLKDTLWYMEIGYGEHTGAFKVEIMPNAARYMDTRTLDKTKFDPKLQLILNTLVDVVEKIEAYAPYV
ncbi:MAG: hypothetical protein QG670_750 [Thermoproteota archaeon]|nr:hypothetical protein [Thermoproteota archaeon]